jgi:hypothetical protein
VFQKKTISLLAAAMMTAAASGTAQASVDLIAIGNLAGTGSDLSTATAGQLENGDAGNILGGIGSGIAYAGCNTFLAVPDRGPNAQSYNSAVDDTVSYIDRFQTLQMDLQPTPDGNGLPFTLTPTLTATTLLSSFTPLVYGDGSAAGLPSGAPGLNAPYRYYFTGRSDNFDPSQLSTYSRDARLDPESIRVSRNGRYVFISDEYGPYIDVFNRASGRRVNSIKLPDMFAVANLSAVGDDEIGNNTSGRLANKGMEGLAISPDGRTLFGAMQSPLIQDGGKAAQYTRIVRIDLKTGATYQYAYPLTNIGSDTKPKYPTISDVVAVNDHEILVDERDGKGLGDDSEAAFKQLNLVDLSEADDVSKISGEANLAPHALNKTLFLDLVAALNAHGIANSEIPSKIEGLAFGPDIKVGGVSKHTLWVSNDNDFLGTVTDTTHPNGVDNPNKFFVFAIDAADLPGYAAQKIHHGVCR